MLPSYVVLMEVKTTIKKLGTSFYLRIPAEQARIEGYQAGDIVSISIKVLKKNETPVSTA